MENVSFKSPLVEFNEHDFRSALSQFATGVTVITTRQSDGTNVGLTVTSFNSVSLEPPLVLWSLGKASRRLESFSRSTHYIINVLAATQLDISEHFSRRLEKHFEGIKFHPSSTDQPILEGVTAWFECSNFRQLPGGDHIIFLGKVEKCFFQPKPPLMFHQGKYKATISELSSHPNSFS